MRSLPWRKAIPRFVPDEAVNLMSSLCTWVPDERPDPFLALLHPYFDELRDEETTLPNGEPLPDLFDFLPDEVALLTPEQLERLTPSWYDKD